MLEIFNHYSAFNAINDCTTFRQIQQMCRKLGCTTGSIGAKSDEHSSIQGRWVSGLRQLEGSDKKLIDSSLLTPGSLNAQCVYSRWWLKLSLFSPRGNFHGWEIKWLTPNDWLTNHTDHVTHQQNFRGLPVVWLRSQFVVAGWVGLRNMKPPWRAAAVRSKHLVGRMSLVLHHSNACKFHSMTSCYWLLDVTPTANWTVHRRQPPPAPTCVLTPPSYITHILTEDVVLLIGNYACVLINSMSAHDSFCFLVLSSVHLFAFGVYMLPSKCRYSILAVTGHYSVPLCHRRAGLTSYRTWRQNAVTNWRLNRDRWEFLWNCDFVQ